MSEPKEGLPEEDGTGKDRNRSVKEISSKMVQKKVVDYWEEGVLRNKIAEATNIVLPNVKELTKKFAKGIEEFTPKTSPTPSAVGQGYANGIAETKTERASSTKKPTATASSNVSPSGSGTSRNSASTAADQEIQTNESSFDETCSTKTADGMVEDEEKNKCGSGESKEAIKISSSVTFAKTSGKEVHSLTARSISKEFREELKNNSNRRALPKIDMGSSGESDRVEVVSESMRNRSPTPPIDLQSKRKFWEDIISNSQKKSAF